MQAIYRLHDTIREYWEYFNPRQKAFSPLDYLPQEVWNQIFSSIDGTPLEKTKTLKNLGAACKEWSYLSKDRCLIFQLFSEILPIAASKYKKCELSWTDFNRSLAFDMGVRAKAGPAVLTWKRHDDRFDSLAIKDASLPAAPTMEPLGSRIFHKDFFYHC